MFLGCQALQQTEAYAPKNEPSKTPSGEDSDYGDPVTADMLQQARDLWLEKNIVNYDIVVRFEPNGQTTGASPVVIKVRNNKTVSVTPISADDKRTTVFYDNFETMQKTFDSVQKDLADNAKVWATFNTKYGYPEKLLVKYPLGSTAVYRLYIDKFDIVNN